MDNISVRLATKEDSISLQKLNEDFNGRGLTSTDFIIDSLENNKQEIVCISECGDKVVGFCCVQIIKSICYLQCHAELTELFVVKEYRRRGVAKRLIEVIESICATYGVYNFQLLTGLNNLPAQELYRSLGYKVNDEMLFVKSIR